MRKLIVVAGIIENENKEIFCVKRSEKIWLKRAELKTLNWAPADLEVVEKLVGEIVD